jgi:hypothetical protein
MAREAAEPAKKFSGMDYAKLFGAYITFYLFMAGWMAIHLNALDGELPPTGEGATALCTTSVDVKCRGPAYNTDRTFAANSIARIFVSRHMTRDDEGGNEVTLGQPRYNGFYEQALITQNSCDDDGNPCAAKLDVNPWTENKKFATSSSVSSAACTSATEGGRIAATSDDGCSNSGMIRINNAWELRVMPTNLAMVCTWTNTDPNSTTMAKVVAVTNPWSLSPMATTADDATGGIVISDMTNTTTTNGVSELKWTWTTGNSFPHMMQYMIVPSAAVAAGTSVTFTGRCKTDGDTWLDLKMPQKFDTTDDLKYLVMDHTFTSPA